MIRYIFIRLIWVVAILFTVLSLNYVLLKLAPDYPPTDKDQRDIYYARQVVDGYMTQTLEYDTIRVQGIIAGTIKLPDRSYFVVETYTDSENNTATRLRIYEPVPIMAQYGNWVKNVLTEGNWGLSTRYRPNVRVFDILLETLPVTLRLNLFALVIYVPLGFGLGILAALKKNSVTDNSISVGVMVFISVPTFVVTILMVLILGYQLRWLPFIFPAADATGLRWWLGMVIPVLGLSFGAIAGLTRFTRAELSEVLTSEFVLLARTKGLTRPQAVIRHAMRNSMVPLVPSIIGSFVGLLSGSVVIERIYSIPGAGRVYLDALTASGIDFNLVLAVSAFYTIIGLVASLLVDLSYGIVDPRIRMGAGK